MSGEVGSASPKLNCRTRLAPSGRRPADLRAAAAGPRSAARAGRPAQGHVHDARGVTFQPHASGFRGAVQLAGRPWGKCSIPGGMTAHAYIDRSKTDTVGAG